MEDCHQLDFALTFLSESRKDSLNSSLKALNSDFYYRNLHMKCPYFWHKCKEDFENSGLKAINAYFLRQLS